MNLDRWLVPLLERYSLWLQLRGRSQRLMDSNREVHVTRFFPLWWDEWFADFRRHGGHHWWAPFNVFLHRWYDGDSGFPHNHPRWNMTLVLTGGLCEVCDRRVYFHGPGSIVWRSPHSFHKLFVPEQFKGKTFTLFFVGRRNYTQQLLKPDGTTTHWAPFDQWMYGRDWDADTKAAPAAPAPEPAEAQAMPPETL